MKKIIILIFNIYLFGILHSQTGFYFKPLAEVKWNHSKFKNQSYQVNTSNGKTINVKAINNYRNNGFNAGINIGYQGRKFFCETGLSVDGAGTGVLVSGFSYTKQDSTYNGISLMSQGGGSGYRKFPLRYGYKLYGRDSVKQGKKMYCNLFLFGGLDILTLIGTPDLSPFGSSGLDFYDKNGVVTKVKLSDYQTGTNWTYYKSIGIVAKFYGKKHKNIFNVAFNFSSAPKYTMLSETRIIVSDANGTKYQNSFFGNGGGFYLTISKDFYPRNWFKRK
jgi:hypothetical protein